MANETPITKHRPFGMTILAISGLIWSCDGLYIHFADATSFAHLDRPRDILDI